MTTDVQRRCQAHLEGRSCPEAENCQTHANWLKEPKKFGSLALPRVLLHACMFFVPLERSGS